MKAPEGSVTWPLTVPLLMDCPNAETARSAAIEVIARSNFTISLSRTRISRIPHHGLVTLL
jgi:hypothetical protein